METVFQPTDLPRDESAEETLIHPRLPGEVENLRKPPAAEVRAQAAGSWAGTRLLPDQLHAAIARAARERIVALFRT